MTVVKSYEEFVNEANLSDGFLSMRKGDAVIVTRDFLPTDLDYKKSATTLWGQKVVSLKNIWAKDQMKENPGRTYKKGDVLFLFTQPVKLDNKGRANIRGYGGGFPGSLAREDQNKFYITPFESTYPYDDMMTQTIILALLSGYASVYSKEAIDPKIWSNLKSSIKVDRIWNAVRRKETVIHEDMEIHKFEYGNPGYILSGFDKTTRNRLPDKFIKIEDILRDKFIANGKEISGDPFQK
jgi:hypothetical protein